MRASTDRPLGEESNRGAPPTGRRRDHSWWQLSGLWVISRGAMAVLFYVTTPWAGGDVGYYHFWISSLRQHGLAATLVEYPTPVVWILQLPYLLGGGTPSGYLTAFIAMMAVLDFALLVLLWVAAGRRLHAAPVVWLIFGCCVGWLAYVRFDMIPAVLVGAALVLFWRRPGLAGGLLGLGAAVKLWPALLFPALLSARSTLTGRLPGAVPRPGAPHRNGAKSAGPGADTAAGHLRPTRGPLTLGFVIVGFGLAVVSLVAGGLPRLLSPLTWQSQRGLQVESVWATPLLVAHALHHAPWRIELSRYNAYEIFGPSVRAWLQVSSVATVAGLVVIIAALGAAFALRRVRPWPLTLLGLLIVLIMIITNKTLSPQYVIWLGGPLAVLFLAADTDRRRRQAWRLAITGMIIAVLTQLIYPLGYGAVVGTNGHWLRGAVMLLVRNVALLGCTGWVAVRYAASIRRALHEERADAANAGPEPAVRSA